MRIGIAALDDAQKQTHARYFTGLEALAEAEATTPEGALAKVRAVEIYIQDEVSSASSMGEVIASVLDDMERLGVAS